MFDKKFKIHFLFVIKDYFDNKIFSSEQTCI